MWSKRSSNLLLYMHIHHLEVTVTLVITRLHLISFWLFLLFVVYFHLFTCVVFNHLHFESLFYFIPFYYSLYNSFKNVLWSKKGSCLLLYIHHMEAEVINLTPSQVVLVIQFVFIFNFIFVWFVLYCTSFVLHFIKIFKNILF